MKLLAIALLIPAFLLIPSSSTVPRQKRQVRSAVVDLRADCLLGGMVGGKLENAETVAKLLRGGERYRFLTMKGRSAERAGEKPGPLGDVCQETMQVTFDNKPERGIAIMAAWEPMPRVPQPIAASNTVYVSAVSALLKSKGIVRPVVKITGAYRVDLDGDGTDEVLISATRYRRGLSSDSHAGDYSLVMVRKVIDGKAETIILAGEYYPKFKDFNAPSEYEISGVVDADGDGRMEVVVFSMYYEGHGTALYRIEGNRAVESIQCGCGV